LRGLTGQKISAEQAFAEITHGEGFMVRATVDLSRVKQKFSAAARKLKKLKPVAPNQDDEDDALNTSTEPDELDDAIKNEEDSILDQLDDEEDESDSPSLLFFPS
jgi:hypothetical protein